MSEHSIGILALHNITIATLSFESHMHTYKIIYLSKLIVLPFTTFVNNMSVYTQPVGHLGVYIYFSYGI